MPCYCPVTTQIISRTVAMNGQVHRARILVCSWCRELGPDETPLSSQADDGVLRDDEAPPVEPDGNENDQAPRIRYCGVWYEIWNPRAPFDNVKIVSFTVDGIKYTFPTLALHQKLRFDLPEPAECEKKSVGKVEVDSNDARFELGWYKVCVLTSL